MPRPGPEKILGKLDQRRADSGAALGGGYNDPFDIGSAGHAPLLQHDYAAPLAADSRYKSLVARIAAHLAAFLDSGAEPAPRIRSGKQTRGPFAVRIAQKRDDNVSHAAGEQDIRSAGRPTADNPNSKRIKVPACCSWRRGRFRIGRSPPAAY